jgi:hypothetical protein
VDSGQRYLGSDPDPNIRFQLLEHDPEKWIPVFGKDHVPPTSERNWRRG